MTQLEEAKRALARLLQDPLTSGPLQELDDVLGRAQNQREYGGMADGTIDTQTWANFTTVANSFRNIQRLAPVLHVPR